MNICENINSFNINYIFYLDPIKNTVIENSNFIRILYSNDILTLNGIYILLDFIDIIRVTHNNRIKYSLNIDTNNKIINFIKNLEKQILDNCNIKNKNQSTKLGELLANGYIKNINIPFYQSENNDLHNQFILKISGIWESEIEYGLTYKILDIIN